jgi:hypothetical protein
MNTDALPADGMSLPRFFAAIVLVWVVTTGLVFPLAWLLRRLPIPHGTGYWGYLLLALLALPIFYWIARIRWPSSSVISRFGFATGLAVFNCVLAMYAAFVVGTLIYGG